ncbi:MAG: hypothetical protein KAW16_01150 [candidate division Zixibacteria bacterium]|nr:hypothetical protein [candidate division Zixibacteria bacterium]
MQKGVLFNQVQLSWKDKTPLRISYGAHQLVRTLVDDDRETGEYLVPWDGRDRRQLTVTSGSCFYRIGGGNYRSCKKLIVAKYV